MRDWNITISFRGKPYRFKGAGPYSDLFHNKMDCETFRNDLPSIKLYVALYVEFLKFLRETPVEHPDGLERDFDIWMRPILSAVSRDQDRYFLYESGPKFTLSPFSHPRSDYQCLVLVKLTPQQFNELKRDSIKKKIEQRIDSLLRQKKEYEKILKELTIKKDEEMDRMRKVN